MVADWSAPAPGDPAAHGRVRRAHEAFLQGAPARVRPLVLESWRRSLAGGADPDRPRVDAIPDAELAARRAAHPLAPYLPLIRSLLILDGAILAVTDERGRLLWLDGDLGVRRRVAGAGFVEGACWAETVAGTNAPGVALATGRPARVAAAEHYARVVQPYSCAAAPVRDPEGRVLGALDLTGPDHVADPRVLALVRAAATTVEAALAARALRDRAAPGIGPVTPGVGPTAPAVGRLRVLGTATGRLGARALTLRHGEILLLLAEHPEGLTADGLAVALAEEDLSPVTVRAEVSRLRRALPGVLAHSRPYRLGAPLTTDLDAVRELLARGDVAGAVAAYRSVLPRSVAPGVVRLRDRLAAEVAAAVTATDDVGALLAWCAGPGEDDVAAWDRLTAIAPAGSPEAVRAAARRRLLDRELAAAPAGRPDRATVLQPPAAYRAAHAPQRRGAAGPSPARA